LRLVWPPVNRCANWIPRTALNLLASAMNNLFSLITDRFLPID
jgi:hypothetical protein